MGDSIRRVLTRHFFNSLFDFGFLSDAGAESFKRLLMGISAVGLGLGLLLLRAFAAKYINLASGPAAEYQRDLLADHAFLLAIPMWIAATTVVCVSHSLFPDETDFRILMAQPVTRPVVFTAKLGALGLFVALFVGGSHVALAPMIGLTIFSSKAGAPFVWSALSYTVASLLACVFAVLAVVSLQGVAVLLAPRAKLVVFATLVRSVLLGLLVLVIPLVLRLPAAAGAFEAQAPWLRWVPPAWFVGLERWLLGFHAHAFLAGVAAAGAVVVCAIAAASYAVLYRRFDRTTVRPSTKFEARMGTRSTSSRFVKPVRLAVTTFTALTMRRSMLHQGIVVALVAASAGFVVNDLYVQLTRPVRRHDVIDSAAWTVLWAPFALMLFASVSVRLALMVPLELRANWVFRMTEDPATRADAIGATVWSVFKLGVLLPVAVASPLQALMLGARTWIPMTIELAAGWLVVEVLMHNWRRIPFTCGYIPGKGFVPQMFVRGLFTFTAFTSIGTSLVFGSLSHPPVQVLAALFTLGPAAFLLMRRRRMSPITPFLFEDELPTEVSPLRLNAD